MKSVLLAYDDGCGPCSRFKSLVEFLDARRAISFVSLGRAEERGALSTVQPSMRYRSFHVAVPGQRVLSGADALLPLAAMLLPAGGSVWRLLDSVPGFRRSARFLYGALSRLHDSGACAGGAWSR